ncbi:NADH-quinone oxidoreductase subunit J family protein [Planctomicrobium sp. SH668]|uniref:NADH-quinone oxidoreductase subunit J family protein n=1 Tax=Planctomicrobium sp. SH668 TaxID=3448126 RepID=UPI003F5B2EC7
MEQVLFGIFAAGACGGALGVVLSQNIVRMAFYLVISLCSAAGLYFNLGADFVGATQLLIYVGGIVVLLIFGVMLTTSSPHNSMKNTPLEILQGGVIGLALLMVIISTALSVDWSKDQQILAQTLETQAVSSGEGFNRAQEGNTSRSIGTALLGMRFDKDLDLNASSEKPVAEKASDAQPKTLSSGYLLPFEIISMHLLVVLIGASYLARTKRVNRESRQTDPQTAASTEPRR